MSSDNKRAEAQPPAGRDDSTLRRVGRSDRGSGTATPQLDATAELIQTKRASRSVLNACHALVVLLEAREPLTLGAFARRAGLAPATAHRILRSLAVYQFVRQNDDSAYELGLGLLELGSAVAEQFDIVRMAHPHMERLAQTTGETVHLAVLEGDSAVYIDKVEGRHSIRLVSRPGYSVPLHATSLGKALCAGLDETSAESLLERLSDVLDDAELDRFRREVSEARRAGYAVDREELLPGLMCVGTAIMGRAGTTLAAISVAGPAFRMEGALQQHADSLRHEAAELSTELGYVGADVGASKRS